MARIRSAAGQERRLEEARVVGSHSLSGGDGRQVGGALVTRLRPKRRAKRDQDEGSGEHDGHHPEQKQESLPVLGRETRS
jgi:hypothetical protein